jgi:hypothetical protein
MSAQVFVYSASRKGAPVFGRLGNRRWECEWYALTAAGQKRHDADPEYEHDHDRDEECCVSVHRTKDEAIAAARTVAPESVYGCALVQEHVLDWMVEEDRVAEWEPCGPQFEVDANGEVARL